MKKISDSDWIERFNNKLESHNQNVRVTELSNQRLVLSILSVKPSDL